MKISVADIKLLFLQYFTKGLHNHECRFYDALQGERTLECSKEKHLKVSMSKSNAFSKINPAYDTPLQIVMISSFGNKESQQRRFSHLFKDQLQKS